MPEEWGALPSVRTYKKKGNNSMISSRYHRKKMTMRGWMFQKVKCLLLFDTNKHEEQGDLQGDAAKKMSLKVLLP